MYELYYQNGRWWSHDLIDAAYGYLPPVANPLFLTSFFDGSVQHVFFLSPVWTKQVPYQSYVTFGANVCELYYQNGIWHNNDLTADTNSPLAAGGLTSFFDGSVQHVFYTSFDVSSQSGHVHELYFNGSWWGNDLTAVTNSPGAYYSGTYYQTEGAGGGLRLQRLVVVFLDIMRNCPDRKLLSLLRCHAYVAQDERDDGSGKQNHDGTFPVAH